MKSFAVSLVASVFAQMCAIAVSDAELNNSTAMNGVAKAPIYRRAAEGGVRVLFIGNSITLHAPLSSIGWTNSWGMAASAREKDFVHLVTAGIERETRRKADLLVRNLADFERGFETYDLKQIDDLVEFRPDYLVVALGENVRSLVTEQDRIAYRAAFKSLLERFCYGRIKPNIVVKGAFWPNPGRDELMAHAASDLAMPFVATPCLKDDMKATGLFAHPGVAAHPGDRGMAYMAEKVLDGFFSQESGYKAAVDGKPVPVMPIRRIR